MNKKYLKMFLIQHTSLTSTFETISSIGSLRVVVDKIASGRQHLDNSVQMQKKLFEYLNSVIVCLLIIKVHREDQICSICLKNS